MDIFDSILAKFESYAKSQADENLKNLRDNYFYAVFDKIINPAQKISAYQALFSL